MHPSDIATVLISLNAKIVITGTERIRTIPIEEFVMPLGSALKTEEMVTEIFVPYPAKASKQTFIKFRLRNALDFAMVSVAANITESSNGTCEDARIVLGSVAPAPLRARTAEREIVGKPIDGSTAEAAAQAAVTGTVPMRKNGYKVELVKTLVRRAILAVNVTR